MGLRFSDHVLTRLSDRGTSVSEIEEVLSKGLSDTAFGARKVKYLIFPFGRRWGGKTYEQKRVRVIYLEDANDIIVVTVYVYYGSWQ